MNKPKAKLVERRSHMNGKRYLVFDSEKCPGIVEDYEDWGVGPEMAYFLAWCIRNKRKIEERLKGHRTFSKDITK